jgi:hypothetical protein
MGTPDNSIDKYAACLPDHLGGTGTYAKQYFVDYPARDPLARLILISPSLVLSDGLWDYSAGTANYQWVEQAVAGARAAGIRWIIVGMARDCVTAGEKRCEIGTDLFNLLVERRVDLILQGHEHGYERSKQLASGPGCTAVPLNAYNVGCVADDGADGRYNKGAGPVIVIAGTLGIPQRPMYPNDPEAPDFAALMGKGLNATYGFMKYTVTTDSLRGEFVRGAGGTFADAFAITGPGNGGDLAQTVTSTPPPSEGPTPPPAVAPAPPAGYWMLGADGRVYPFGDAVAYGGGGRGAVDIEPTPSRRGYWVLDAAGRVSAFGDAPELGGVSPGQLGRGESATSLSATPSGEGYWIFTTRGRAVNVGDAASLGDVSGLSLRGPVVDSVATPTGRGYYMVASDGGIFAFGDATFQGSMGDHRLNAPVQSLVPGRGGGYWLVASDGGVFAFRTPFRGSMGGARLNLPITGMVPYGDGYLMVGEDGGIFNFSDRPFVGSLGAHPPDQPIVAVAAL